MVQIFSPTKIEKDEFGGAYSTQDGGGNMPYFNKKSEDSKSLGRPKYEREDGTERMWEVVD
jgi:hypothetical protein